MIVSRTDNITTKKIVKVLGKIKIRDFRELGEEENLQKLIRKAKAMGADAIAIGTSALMAIGCQQYRICNTGKCPMGIATQNKELRKRLEIDKSAKQLENFLRVSTEELKTFARLTGNNDVHKLSITDLCTTNSEISNHTVISHV